MKKIILLFTALFIAVFSTGCKASDFSGISHSVISADDKLRPQGSARFLEGKSLLVTIIIEDEKSAWTDEELAYADFAVKSSRDFIAEQGKQHNKSVELLCTADGCDDLKYRLKLNGAADLAKNDYDKYEQLFYKLVTHSIPEDTLAEKYGTDSIAYIALIDCEGTSYANVYGDGDGDVYYRENAVMFMYDNRGDGSYESVSAYAHEILHLFGAVDLYVENEANGVTREIVDYYKKNEPTELMFDTYEPDGSINMSGINQHLSDVTLAMIGFTDGSEVYARYPTLYRKDAASFGTNEVRR